MPGTRRCSTNSYEPFVQVTASDLIHPRINAWTFERECLCSSVSCTPTEKRNTNHQERKGVHQFPSRITFLVRHLRSRFQQHILDRRYFPLSLCASGWWVLCLLLRISDMASSPPSFRHSALLLEQSINKGDLATVKQLVCRRGKALLNYYNSDGNAKPTHRIHPPTYSSAWIPHIDMHLAPAGCSPFLLACKNSFAIAKYLQDAGASLTERDKDSKRQVF